MALMERVTKLLRANLNDLIQRAEDPATMVKQVILDMENQLMQVKTQVAIGIADLHLLERKRDENASKGEDWVRKAQLALAKKQEDLAKAALARSIEFGKLSKSFDQQIEDQRVQVDNLKTALRKLTDKLQGLRARNEILQARQRRGKSAKAAFEAQTKAAEDTAASVWDRMTSDVDRGEAIGAAGLRMAADWPSGRSVEERFREIEENEEVERLLAELKSRQAS